MSTKGSNKALAKRMIRRTEKDCDNPIGKMQGTYAKYGYGGGVDQRSKVEDDKDRCPDCGSHLMAKWSGVECSKCDYWFCY